MQLPEILNAKQKRNVFTLVSIKKELLVHTWIVKYWAWKSHGTTIHKH